MRIDICKHTCTVPVLRTYSYVPCHTGTVEEKCSGDTVSAHSRYVQYVEVVPSRNINTFIGDTVRAAEVRPAPTQPLLGGVG